MKCMRCALDRAITALHAARWTRALDPKRGMTHDEPGLGPGFWVQQQQHAAPPPASQLPRPARGYVTWQKGRTAATTTHLRRVFPCSVAYIFVAMQRDVEWLPVTLARAVATHLVREARHVSVTVLGEFRSCSGMFSGAYFTTARLINELLSLTSGDGPLSRTSPFRGGG